MPAIAEQVGRGAWEAARFRGEYEGTAYSRFLCRIVVGDKTLTGIINVWKGGKESAGTLLIPTEVTGNSPLADAVEENVAQFATPNYYYEDQIAQELGLVLDRHYADLQVSSLRGRPDRLGIYSSLTVSNRFSASASRTPEPGDTGAAMGLAQHIMNSLPEGWQITPEPVMSR